jgi:hypothetical protein
MPELSTRLANTGQLLVYSGIEIDRILSSMVDDRSAISASLPQQDMFLSRLLLVDPVKQRLMIAESDSRQANAELLKLATVNFRCHHRWGQFAFSGARPRPAELAGQPAIEMASPSVVLALQHNKKVVRAAAPTSAPDLRCQLPIGTITLEARLVDMSVDGHAFLLGDAGLPICAGTWIRGARITPSGEQPVSADIELKYVMPTVLPSGERATRIGCRIVAADDVMEKIVKRFIIDFQ